MARLEVIYISNRRIFVHNVLNRLEEVSSTSKRRQVQGSYLAIKHTSVQRETTFTNSFIVDCWWQKGLNLRVASQTVVIQSSNTSHHINRHLIPRRYKTLQVIPRSRDPDNLFALGVVEQSRRHFSPIPLLCQKRVQHRLGTVFQTSNCTSSLDFERFGSSGDDGRRGR